MLSPYIHFFALSVALLLLLSLSKEFRTYKGILIALVSFIAVFVLLLRDWKAPPDIGGYISMYENIESLSDVFKSYHGNYFFSYVQWLGKVSGLTPEVFFYTLPVLYLIILLIAFRLIFKDRRKYVLAFSLFILTSTFIFLFTNVLRQGMSLLLMLLAIGLHLRGKYLLKNVIMLLAVYSHLSALPIWFLMVIYKPFRVIFLKSNASFFTFLLLLPVIYIFSTFVIVLLPSISPIFNKILGNSYINNLVYIKVFILYFFMIFSYMISKRYDFLNEPVFNYLFSIFSLLLVLVFFFLPVQLLASRFIYYASALMPLLIPFIMLEGAFLNFQLRYAVLLLLSYIYGLLVYSSSSIQSVMFM
jgi:hypothetical protein